MARAQHGFSLVEVLVAILLLSSGALAAATVLQQVTQALAMARHTTTLSQAALSKVAQFRSLVWDFEEVSPGVFTPIEDAQTDLSQQPFAGGGHGVAPGASGDHVGESGQWAGGAVPTAEATVVRTWRIRPHGTAPNLRVMVVDLQGHQVSGGSASPVLALRDRVVAIRSRGLR